MGSGFKTFVSATKLTASDVNNYLQKQSIMYFATTAARDSAIVSPEDGMTCYIGSNDSSEGLYTYNGSAWRKGPGWNAPWGPVGHFSTTTTYSRNNNTTAEIDPAFRISVSTCANRRLRLTFRANLTNADAGGTVDFYNNTTSTTLGRAFQDNDVLNVKQCDGSLVIDSSASTTVYTIRWASVLVTFGVVGTIATTNVSPTQFTIEDIGPSGAPV